MALIDDVHIIVKAGDGGRGGTGLKKVAAGRKTIQDGGNGGSGGSIWFLASHNVSDLNQFQNRKEIVADNGENGMNKNLFGKNAADITIHVPIGTKIFDEKDNKIIELLDTDTPVLIARGGRGGLGNHNYKFDLRTYNSKVHEGEAGEKKNLHLVLSLIANIGLIGFPNAGKSSLLDALTNATPKIGNYPFTTLEPNLGVMGKLIIADIPGLIEGASKGHGLGIKFLKHIEKTQALIHCIDSQELDPVEKYKTLRFEMNEYNPTLSEKEEIILLTKIDLIDTKTLDEKITSLRQFKRTIIPISIYDEKSLQSLQSTLESIK